MPATPKRKNSPSIEHKKLSMHFDWKNASSAKIYFLKSSEVISSDELDRVNVFQALDFIGVC
jgi:hypothetical protein